MQFKGLKAFVSEMVYIDISVYLMTLFGDHETVVVCHLVHDLCNCPRFSLVG